MRLSGEEMLLVLLLERSDAAALIGISLREMEQSGS